jgi:tetratricopeptide (TPR) repeat protein
MRSVNDAKILKSLFSGGCILLMTLSMMGCATAPMATAPRVAAPAATAPEDYALTSKNYYEKGQYDEAIKSARQGIALNPSHAPNWYWLGVGYYMRGQYDEAIQPFKKVIEFKSEGLLQSSHSHLGVIYHRKGNYDEAILSDNKALELDPHDINTLVNRSWSYYQKGNFNEAMNGFTKAIENIKPEEKATLQEALRGKGFSYLGLGDGETAVNLVKQAKSALDYNTNYDLSLIYYVMGNKEKAWEFRGGKGAVGIEVRDYKKGEINGANVVKTMSGGPAEKSGIIAGDVIIKLNNAQVSRMEEFVRMIAVLEPGTTAKIKVIREGMEKEVVIKVAFADFLMEGDQLIVPILAKDRGDSGVKAFRESASSAQAKSDVDELPISSARINKNAYAIVIGIEQYRQKLPKADFAVNDALTVANYLSKVMGYPEQNIITLTGEHAAKSDLEKYFEKWLWNNVEKDSTVFVYFSGHGAPNPKTGDAYLVPYDGDPSFIEQTGYSLKRLYESLNKLQAKEIIVALDSCFSGAGGRSVLAKGARPLVMNLRSDVVLSKNMTVLSASSSDQTSSTYDEKGHGLFTYFMLKGIKNEDVVRPDGSIKMDDLFDYIKPQVERIARKQYNNEQTPQLIGAKNK